MMKYKLPLKLVFRYTLVISLSICLLLFVIGGVWIGYEVKSQCRLAQSEYGGDCTQALTSLLQDESRGFKPRNSAIWALGQLGDPSAGAVLQSYYTGIIPEREPLDQMISQYELQKAINLVNGGPNITAIFWRF